MDSQTHPQTAVETYCTRWPRDLDCWPFDQSCPRFRSD